MRSKIANRELEAAKRLVRQNNKSRDIGYDVDLVTAKHCVELAEDDARERAMKALCHQSCYGKCPLVVPYSGCGKMNAFLGFYDKTE